MVIQRNKKGKITYFSHDGYEEKTTYNIFGKVKHWENSDGDKEITTYNIFGGRKIKFIYKDGIEHTYKISRKGTISVVA